jgi:putative effector of murein hydrolase
MFPAVTRGLATAGSCHGLGTAALAAKEPAALPFCALAYGLIGIAGAQYLYYLAIQLTGDIRAKN